MARYKDAVCRLCRREGMKLFLKGSKCFTDKCPVEKRNYAPGQHGKDKKTKIVGYGLQLREKQKAKRMYFVGENQFRNYYEVASNAPGVTGEILLQQLERRLDTLVFRLGFANARRQARQLVRHGHIAVNGKKVNIPSYLLKAGDVVELKEKSRGIAQIQQTLTALEKRGFPTWLEIDKTQFRGKVLALPARDESTMPTVKEQLVVELYSK